MHLEPCSYLVQSALHRSLTTPRTCAQISWTTARSCESRDPSRWTNRFVRPDGGVRMAPLHAGGSSIIAAPTLRASRGEVVSGAESASLRLALETSEGRIHLLGMLAHAFFYLFT